MDKSEFQISNFKFQKSVFSTVLLPTVECISLLLRSNEIVLERHENFQKQSNRSRFHILSPNGMQTLQIPLVHNKSPHSLITEIEISYRSPWQTQHWRSIQTAYNRSPFFEFYKDELEEIYLNEEKLLFNFNINLLKWVLKVLKSGSAISFTADFEKEISNDFRALSNSKNNSIVYPEHFISKKYNQVFGYKFDFTENLSVIDLIFNCGKNAVEYLK